MIKIIKPDDISNVKDKKVIPYIENLMQTILNAYYPNSSLEAVGAIFFLEDENDINQYKEMGLSSPLTENNLDWMQKFADDYMYGCIVIDNDFAINIIGKQEYFKGSDDIENNKSSS